MDDLNLNFDLDVSLLSAIELQRIGVTIAQVRAAYAEPVDTIEPEANSQFPDVWRLLGFTNNCRFIFVTLAYVGATGKFTALGVQVAGTVAEVRQHLCRS